MTNEKSEQMLARFLRDGQAEVPAAPIGLEDQIWRRAKLEPKAKAKPALFLLPLLLAAAAASTFFLWPKPVDSTQDDDELASFVEDTWEGTFDETSVSYELTQIAEDS